MLVWFASGITGERNGSMRMEVECTWYIRTIFTMDLGQKAIGKEIVPLLLPLMPFLLFGSVQLVYLVRKESPIGFLREDEFAVFGGDFSAGQFLLHSHECFGKPH